VLGGAAIGAQQGKLADAALAAGVKRFIPSEFGINPRVVSGQPIGNIGTNANALLDSTKSSFPVLLIQTQQLSPLHYFLGTVHGPCLFHFCYDFGVIPTVTPIVAHF